MLSSRFSILGIGGSNKVDGSSNVVKNQLEPTLRLVTDKDVYGPGDSIYITVEISQASSVGLGRHESVPTLLIERLGFELKGIEKLDVQWFATQKPLHGSRQRRGEHVFLDSSAPAIVSNQLLPSGVTKTYMVRVVLPDIIPPSYRGATIRYLYYVKCILYARWLIMEDGHPFGDSEKDFVEVDSRTPLQIWVTQKNNGLLMENGQNEGIVPATTIQTEISWKAMDGDSEWARANDIYDGGEEGYESSHDEISSLSSYRNKEKILKTFGSSLSLQSSAARSSFKDGSYLDGESANLPSSVALPKVSVAEVLYDSGVEVLSPNKSPGAVSPSTHRKSINTSGSPSTPSTPREGASEPGTSEGFIRGRSYNIRMDDQVLLRFSPKNSESTYYFSDTIGGTLTFFHEEGARRCLEVSITLETSETINRRLVHPSRRNAPTITKVQSDHYEIVADLVQTSFLFSIPMDGPMSFATPHVSVQWALRFEFFTTPKDVDWKRYEHPLLIDGRDRSEWVLPITVHAPPRGTTTVHNRSEKPFALESLWVRT